MINFLADVDATITQATIAWRPPPKLTLSEWADEFFYLSAESSAQAGKWVTLPYQKGILDAITDPEVTHVSVMKSARVGYTKCINAAVGYHIHQDPCSMLVVQPSASPDAEGYSKEEIAPMLRDVPVLSKIVFEDVDDDGPRDGGNTILHKRFPGGVLSMTGATSGAGFRRISRRVVIFDEVDAYPPSAGSDGDPVKLGTKRAEYFWNRKIIAGSTPLIAGHSRIEEMFELGDQRRYYVPCPHCGYFDYLVFSRRESGGHYMAFTPEAPQDAHFVCFENGCVIEHKDKREMVARGEWRASKPFTNHASFHIWAAYSFSPNATWAQLAAEFVEAKAGGPEKLKTFINTVLGETWKSSGEAPDWELLYRRRETYLLGSVPAGVQFLTCGVDVQKDRWVYEVVGWGFNKESWSIDAGVIPGDTANEAHWARVSDLLDREYLTSAGTTMSIHMLAIDSGYNTQQVYNWARTKPLNRVIAVKGASVSRTLISVPTPVDVNHNGQRISRGYKVWPVGTDVAKSELYGWLKLPTPIDEGAPFPAGYCHFPQHPAEWFRQLTAEHLVSVTRKRTGYTIHEWQQLPGRENHYLDCRVYARAAAAVLGLDRVAPPGPSSSTQAPTRPVAPPITDTRHHFVVRPNRGRKPWL